MERKIEVTSVEKEVNKEIARVRIEHGEEFITGFCLLNAFSLLLGPKKEQSIEKARCFLKHTKDI